MSEKYAKSWFCSFTGNPRMRFRKREMDVASFSRASSPRSSFARMPTPMRNVLHSVGRGGREGGRGGRGREKKEGRMTINLYLRS